MDRRELRIPVLSTEDGDAWEIATTLYLPAAVARVERPPVLVALPGAGYSRHYFDLPEPGYSEAAHHCALGTVVVALDHLGVGESSVPPLETTTMAVVAAANHAAVITIVERLLEGTLDSDLGPTDPACVVGAGQSMGGHVLVAMQAVHQTFDGVAVLGASMVHTSMPSAPGRPDVSVSADDVGARERDLVAQVPDFRYAYFWDDVPPSLVEADIAGGHPRRRSAPAWGSTTFPSLAGTLVSPGVVADEAASIDVPVLVAMGERDVCQDLTTELAAFASATDITGVVLPRMAHMHNFAGTRRQLWRRIDAFLAQVATSVAENGPRYNAPSTSEWRNRQTR